MKAHRLALALLLQAGAATACAQILQGQVDAVGFQTSGGFVLREGQWFPVSVSLRCQGSQVFSGELRVEAIDLDGDRVAFTQPQVTVTPEVGPLKRFWCYAAVNRIQELPQSVEVVDSDGALVTELPMPPQPPFPLVCDDLLVLDISARRVTALSALQEAEWSPGQHSDGLRRFYRNVVIAHMPAANLPDRWWGLEAVDVVVWDQPDPAALSLAQRDALVEWVRCGGQLVVGVGPTWSALRRSELASILPLTGEAETREVRQLNVFFDHLARPAWKNREFPNLVAVTTAKLADGALPILRDYGNINLVSMCLAGSGRVTATAASLRDLTSVEIDQIAFLAQFLDLNAYTDQFKAKLGETTQVYPLMADPLYDEVVAPVAFAAATALRGLTALLFVAGYVALATLVSWWWLRARGLTYLSWTVFAGLAAAASGLSLGTVGALRGCSRGVQALSVLDLEAGSSAARGTCLFGYRSPTRQRVELSLPGEGNFLRPLAKNPRGGSYYVTPARYAALPTRASLREVLMRATLKQVEGFWQGQLDGTLRANLVVDRGTGRLSPASWIANDLTMDLAGGYLLFIDPRQQDGPGVPWRAAGLNTLYELPGSIAVQPDLEKVPPAVNILVVPLPKIAAGQQISGLGQADYHRVDRNQAEWRGAGGRKRSQMLKDGRDLRTLWEEQQAWAGTGTFAVLRTGLGDTLRALLLASTRNYYLPNHSQDFDSVGTPISTDGLPNQDITHWLVGGRQEGQAVLICWAEHPGPARLHRNGKPLDSYQGLTLLRVRVPIRYEGRPPSGAQPVSPGSA
jgi:hypothetical protein